jgi:hypothetical protein
MRFTNPADTNRRTAHIMKFRKLAAIAALTIGALGMALSRC